MNHQIEELSFLADVAEGAHVPERDAKALVSDFVSAVSGFVGEEATAILIDLTPTEVDFDPGPDRGGDASIEEFLLAMSDEEGVATGRAAEHARVVAEAIRSRAPRGELTRLQDAIENEGILALFELGRGELTEPEAPTAGKRAQSGE